MLVGELMYDCDQYKARNETCGDAILAAILALHNKSHQGSLWGPQAYPQISCGSQAFTTHMVRSSGNAALKKEFKLFQIYAFADFAGLMTGILARVLVPTLYSCIMPPFLVVALLLCFIGHFWIQGSPSSFLGGIDWFDYWAFGLDYQAAW